jgi:hypothetical protein
MFRVRNSPVRAKSIWLRRWVRVSETKEFLLHRKMLPRIGTVLTPANDWTHLWKSLINSENEVITVSKEWSTKVTTFRTALLKNWVLSKISMQLWKLLTAISFSAKQSTMRSRVSWSSKLGRQKKTTQSSAKKMQSYKTKSHFWKWKSNGFAESHWN